MALIAALLWLAGATGADAAPAAVSSAQIARPPADTQGPTQPIDVVVLLDDSGSMATCWPWPREGPPFFPPCRAPSFNPPSDPEELRYSAARLLLELADPDDRLAVVRFDSGVEGVGALASLQPVGDGTNRRQLSGTLQPPNDYYRRGYTRIDLGLERAIELLQQAQEPGRNQYVLLLTDGEPSQPDGVGSQRDRILAQLQTLRDAGIFVFPVVLCNPSAGCAGEFLREQFAAYGVREAATPQDLLQVFGAIFAEMKPDRSIIAPQDGSTIRLTTRDSHGVQRITFVTPRNGLGAVQRDEQPVLPQNVLNDPNIDVNQVSTENLAPGTWRAEIAGGGGFAVVQAASYVQLLNPPPSVADSPASVRYYPAGHPPLLMARSVGPGAQEPIIYNGQVPLESFGQNNTRALLLDEEPDLVRLQLGEDTQPLQLVRTFRLEARPALPRAQVLTPEGGAVVEGGPGGARARLQVGFTGGNVRQLAATAYVFTQDQAGNSQLVHQVEMDCTERLCTDESFRPVDGHSYRIFYVIQGQLDGLRFSDWAESQLVLEPAVVVQGLPLTADGSLDLGQMPLDGWPVEVSSSTLEEIGGLSAVLRLTDAESGEPVPGVGLNFLVDVPETGSQPARLQVQGLETLRPGQYAGEITWQTTDPAGRPMDVRIRPAATLPVTYTVPRPLARVEAQTLDFGEVLFDTSPNFRLDQTVEVPVQFADKAFPLAVTLEESTCAQVAVAAGDLIQREGRTFLPLRLTSLQPVPPGSCTGTLRLAGPDGDYDVVPAQVTWRARVANVEWSVVSGELPLGDWQDAGSRVNATLLIRFTGKLPFILQVEDLTATSSEAGGASEGQPTTLSLAQIDVPQVVVDGPPQEDGLYQVPLTLVARQAIPHDPWRGTFYSGRLTLGIVGLPERQQVSFNFRSPSLPQRYLAPYLVPVYSMPWVLCTGPLTALLLLVAVARIRGRGIDEEELEQAAMAATLQMPLAPPAAADAYPEPVAEGASGAWDDAAWEQGEWGSVWDTGQPAGARTPQVPPANGAAAEDPWRSSW